MASCPPSKTPSSKLRKKNEGLLSLQGQQGLGKTSTLYAILQTIQTPHLNIVTLEQPIEYRMNGVKQTEIQDDGKLSFEAGVRSLLRQDPDIILIGETRDTETAKWCSVPP
ncbi:MAG: Flp pilus assembly complex ATPase component TadA [Holosporaceae bacterium]|nr:MAG: Flp pilus assembly complex ATPase component TadA [Holosporaceae bacterium]